MTNNIKSIKISLIITNIFIVFLFIFTIALPFAVSWYVETMHRSQTLPAIIMVTCYPCTPFVAIVLFSLRKILSNIINNSIFTETNSKCIKNITICCLIISLITLIAGKFYLPFLIVGITFAFLSLISYTIKNVFKLLETDK